MDSLHRTRGVSALVGALLALVGCSGQDEQAGPYLSQTQTQQRGQMLSPSRVLFGIELDKQVDFPACGEVAVEPKPTCLDGEDLQLHPSEIADFMDRTYLTLQRDAAADVQSITAVTKLTWSTWTLDMLTSKYGKPDYRAPGGPSEFSYWTWSFKDAVVSYLDNGQFVIVSMKTAEQAQREYAEAEKGLEAQAKTNALKRQL